MIKTYKKKPFTTKGICFTGENLKELIRFVPKNLLSYKGDDVYVTTLNGIDSVFKGDIVMQYNDVLGKHFRVYKPDYVAANYEEVTEAVPEKDLYLRKTSE